MTTRSVEARRRAKQRRSRRLAVLGVAAALTVAVTVVLVSRSGPEVPVAAVPAPAPAPSSAPTSPAAPASPTEAPDPVVEDVADQLGTLVPDFDVIDPVGLDEDATFEDGVLARIVDIERAEIGARGPGESAGSGVVVTVELENASGKPIALDGVVIDFYDDTDAPAVVSYGDERTEEFSSTLKPGKVVRGTYVARLANPTTSLTLTVSHEPGAPAVSFTGKL